MPGGSEYSSGPPVLFCLTLVCGALSWVADRRLHLASRMPGPARVDSRSSPWLAGTSLQADHRLSFSAGLCLEFLRGALLCLDDRFGRPAWAKVAGASRGPEDRRCPPGAEHQHDRQIQRDTAAATRPRPSACESVPWPGHPGWGQCPGYLISLRLTGARFLSDSTTAASTRCTL
jgi:hypothetical protein